VEVSTGQQRRSRPEYCRRNRYESRTARVVPLQAGRMMVRAKSAFFHEEHEEGKERIEVVPRRHAFVLKRMRRVLF
jgi:hypothetical protein